MLIPASRPFLHPAISLSAKEAIPSCRRDVDAGKADNTASTRGTPPTGPAVTDTASESVPAVQTPTLTVVKTAAPSTYAKAGDVISYSYLVTNSGNVTLYGLTVVDDKATVTCPDTSAGLAPLGTITCTASYTIVAADITAGSVTNTAYATDGTTQSEPDSETVTFVNIPPDISVTKTANPISVPESGGNVTFTFVVTNNAPEAATITSLLDNKFGTLAGDDDCQLGTSPGGQRWKLLLHRPPSRSRPTTNLVQPHQHLCSRGNGSRGLFGHGDPLYATVTSTDVKPTVTLDKSVDARVPRRAGRRLHVHAACHQHLLGSSHHHGLDRQPVGRCG